MLMRLRFVTFIWASCTEVVKLECCAFTYGLMDDRLVDWLEVDLAKGLEVATV